MNQIKAFATVALLAACGSEDDWLPSDLGTLEQGFGGKVTPTYQHGTRTGSTRMACDKVTSSQVCAVPPATNMTYCIHTMGSGQLFSAAEATLIRNEIEAFDATRPNWTLTETLLTNCAGFTGHIPFFANAVGSSGTSSSNVNDYGKIGSFGTLTNLTEGSGVVGSYQSWSKCTINIDRVDILAKGANQVQDDLGLEHAALHSFFGCLGIGGKDSGPSDYASRILFNPASMVQPEADQPSPGENCQLNAYSLSEDGKYFQLAPDCTTD